MFFFVVRAAPFLPPPPHFAERNNASSWLSTTCRFWEVTQAFAGYQKQFVICGGMGTRFGEICALIIVTAIGGGSW